MYYCTPENSKSFLEVLLKWNYDSQIFFVSTVLEYTTYYNLIDSLVLKLCTP